MTFAAGLGADLFASRRLFLVKNMLSVCSTPLEVLIAVLYWGLKIVCSIILLMGVSVDADS